MYRELEKMISQAGGVAAVAEKAGMDSRALRAILTGERNMSLGDIQRLYDALNMTHADCRRVFIEGYTKPRTQFLRMEKPRRNPLLRIWERIKNCCYCQH